MNASTTPMNNAEFSGKRALVTGGTKETGKAIADKFLRTGAKVIVAARSAPETFHGDCFIEADVSKPEGTTKVAQRILHR